MDLALKYRPKTFEDVVGQNFITNILSKQIKTNTHKNAYLFCGAHGCGKTTCARIFSNEINNKEEQAIEIDGASNNGVDNIRALIEDAQQSSIDCDYKVYIIDEAHMITIQGWNAALKLIEEPPLHCIFIFCTTNPEKIPNTILSRVQRFDFKKIPIDTISNRLIYILNSENINTFDKKALHKISILSNGHMRDAIKILESCLDVNTNITLDLVETLFGLVKQESIDKILASMIDCNFEECIAEYNHCKSMSFDGLKLYDALFAESLQLLIDIATNNMNTHNITNYLKTRDNANITKQLKNISNNMYETKKSTNKDNADVMLQYEMIRCCQ